MSFLWRVECALGVSRMRIEGVDAEWLTMAGLASPQGRFYGKKAAFYGGYTLFELV